jgi:hypothetical protein
VPKTPRLTKSRAACPLISSLESHRDNLDLTRSTRNHKASILRTKRPQVIVLESRSSPSIQLSIPRQEDNVVHKHLADAPTAPPERHDSMGAIPIQFRKYVPPASRAGEAKYAVGLGVVPVKLREWWVKSFSLALCFRNFKCVVLSWLSNSTLGDALIANTIVSYCKESSAKCSTLTLGALPRILD